MSIKYAAKQPGPIGLVLGSLFGMFLGSVLALAHLIDRPVEVVNKLPEKPDEGVNYYVRPATVSFSAWESKKGALNGPGALATLTEAEAASFVAVSLRDAIRKDKPAPEAGQPEDIAGTIADGVGLKLADNRVQLGVVVETHRLGGPRPLVLQTEGTFVKRPKGWMFAPETAKLGGLDIGRLPGGKAMMAAIGAELTPSALGGAEEVTVAAGLMTVRMP